MQNPNYVGWWQRKNIKERKPFYEELYPSQLALANKYWREAMPTADKVLAAVMAGQMMRVVGEDILGLNFMSDDKKSGVSTNGCHFFVVMDEADHIQNLSNLTVLQEQANAWN